MLKEFFKRIGFLISVPKCVFCGEKLEYEDWCLCQSCMEIYLDSKKRDCSRCAKVLSECSCTSSFLEKHYVKRLIKVYRYSTKEQSTPGNYLIYALKQTNRGDVFDFLSVALKI